MTQKQIKAIADAYINAEHNPLHASYDALVSETIDQYNQIRARGVNVLLVPGTISYFTPKDLYSDISIYDRFVVATGGAPFAPSHPLVRPLQGWDGPTVNTAFRAVHDYFGHYENRIPFNTFIGEIHAYQKQAREYSKAARPALFAEIVGQLCYFATYKNFVPVQKACILPNELLESVKI